MTTKGNLSADLEKYYWIECGSDRPAFGQRLRLWIDGFGLHCVVVYRFGRWASELSSRNRLLGLLPWVAARILTYLMKAFHHVHIEGARIGPGLYIGHVGTIYIGYCDIGSNLSITHNVTIGIGHSQGKVGVPTIGNNVWIGTASVISGAISVGNNVTMMPGSILSRDVPDHCLVGGNPARVAMQNYDNSPLFPGPSSSGVKP